VQTSRTSLQSSLYKKNFSAAFKLATQEIKEARDNGKAGKRGFGIKEICKRIYASHLYREEDKKLKPSTLAAAVNKGIVRMLPPKAGRPAVIPNKLTKGLATHANMMQISGGDGEESGRKMMALVKAMSDGTAREDKFSPEYAWSRAQTQHPEIFVRSKAKDHED